MHFAIVTPPAHKCALHFHSNSYCNTTLPLLQYCMVQLLRQSILRRHIILIFLLTTYTLLYSYMYDHPMHCDVMLTNIHTSLFLIPTLPTHTPFLLLHPYMYDVYMVRIYSGVLLHPMTNHVLLSLRRYSLPLLFQIIRRDHYCSNTCTTYTM